MDHSKLGSNSGPSNSPELPNTLIGDNGLVETLEAAAETDLAAADPEVHMEWKQFIRQEVERLQNPENTGRKRDPKEAETDTSPPATSDQALASIIERLPVERLIDSAVRFLKKKAKPKKSKKSKKHRRR